MRLVNTRPYWPGRYRARWAARADDTTSGMGTVRKPALLFGGPNSGTPRRAETSWRSTRTWRRRKSTRSTVRPKHSPCRSPIPAAKTMSARYRSGTASTIASTSLTDRGTTSASLHLGSVIPMHGEEASSRSPTAALKIVATHRYTSSTDRGAKTRGELLHPRLHVAAADGAQLAGAEVRVGVEPEVGLDLRGGPGAVDLHRPPPLGVLLEQRPAAGGVDVHAVGQVAPDGVEEQLGVALAGEVADLLRARPGTPATGRGTARRTACRCSPSAPPHSP